MSRYKAYAEYKNSGLQWLGYMPNHWKLRKSKYIFSRVQREVRSVDGVVTAFRDGQVTLRANRRTEGFTESIKEIGYQGVRKGDLLVHAMDGFAGAIGVSDSDGKCSPVCSVCIPTDEKEVHVGYFGYLVRQLAVTDYISSLAKGIRERSTEFRYSEFSVLDLALPPKNEQKKIAAFLDHETVKIDALIEKQQRLIELLKEKRQAVISHAVTKGLNPNAPMKDSGVEWLGEVPAHWQLMRIKHLIRFFEQGWSPQCDSRPAEESEFGVLKVGCVNGGVFNPEENKALPPELEPKIQYTLKKGDFLISRANTRELAGSAAVVNSDFDKLLLCDKLYRLRFLSEVNPQLISFYLSIPPVRQQIELGASGASDSMQNISQSVIRDLFVLVPPETEANLLVAEIRNRISKFNAILEGATTQVSYLQERRTALISAAVTGKIDVRNWQPAAAQDEAGIECCANLS